MRYPYFDAKDLVSLLIEEGYAVIEVHPSRTTQTIENEEVKYETMES